MHGQSDSDDAEDQQFIQEVVHKSINEAMTNHNSTFLNTFWNIMKEVFHGVPLDQYGPAYFNIPQPSEQETNHFGTS
jgi:hypothetical protein